MSSFVLHLLTSLWSHLLQCLYYHETTPILSFELAKGDFRNGQSALQWCVVECIHVYTIHWQRSTLFLSWYIPLYNASYDIVRLTSINNIYSMQIIATPIEWLHIRKKGLPLTLIFTSNKQTQQYQNSFWLNMLNADCVWTTYLVGNVCDIVDEQSIILKERHDVTDKCVSALLNT